MERSTWLFSAGLGVMGAALAFAGAEPYTQAGCQATGWLPPALCAADPNVVIATVLVVLLCASLALIAAGAVDAVRRYV